MKVKCIKRLLNSDNITIGKIYDVMGLYLDCYYILNDLYNRSYYPKSQFEIVNEQQNMEELKITKEKVLEAASKCPQSKETLKTLFPDVFEDDKYIDLSCSTGTLKCIDGKTPKFILDGNISIRTFRSYEYKSFYLSSSYNWEIKKDSVGTLCLIPTKK